MADDSQHQMVRILANGATAQLRDLAELAEGDNARRIHAELKRIAAKMEVKHNWGESKIKVDKQYE